MIENNILTEDIKVDKYQKLRDCIHDEISKLTDKEWITLDDLSKRLEQNSIKIPVNVLRKILTDFADENYNILEEEDEDWLYYDKESDIVFSSLFFEQPSSLGKSRKKEQAKITYTTYAKKTLLSPINNDIINKIFNIEDPDDYGVIKRFIHKIIEKDKIEYTFGNLIKYLVDNVSKPIDEGGLDIDLNDDFDIKKINKWWIKAKESDFDLFVPILHNKYGLGIISKIEFDTLTITVIDEKKMSEKRLKKDVLITNESLKIMKEYRKKASGVKGYEAAYLKDLGYNKKVYHKVRKEFGVCIDYPPTDDHVTIKLEDFRKIRIEFKDFLIDQNILVPKNVKTTTTTTTSPTTTSDSDFIKINNREELKSMDTVWLSYTLTGLKEEHSITSIDVVSIKLKSKKYPRSAEVTYNIDNLIRIGRLWKKLDIEEPKKDKQLSLNLTSKESEYIKITDPSELYIGQIIYTGVGIKNQLVLQHKILDIISTTSISPKPYWKGPAQSKMIKLKNNNNKVITYSMPYVLDIGIYIKKENFRKLRSVNDLVEGKIVYIGTNKIKQEITSVLSKKFIMQNITLTDDNNRKTIYSDDYLINTTGVYVKDGENDKKIKNEWIKVKTGELQKNQIFYLGNEKTEYKVFNISGKAGSNTSRVIEFGNLDGNDVGRYVEYYLIDKGVYIKKEEEKEENLDDEFVKIKLNDHSLLEGMTIYTGKSKQKYEILSIDWRPITVGANRHGYYVNMIDDKKNKTSVLLDYLIQNGIYVKKEKKKESEDIIKIKETNWILVKSKNELSIGMEVYNPKTNEYGTITGFGVNRFPSPEGVKSPVTVKIKNENDIEIEYNIKILLDNKSIYYKKEINETQQIIIFDNKYILVKSPDELYVGLDVYLKTKKDIGEIKTIRGSFMTIKFKEGIYDYNPTKLINNKDIFKKEDTSYKKTEIGFKKDKTSDTDDKIKKLFENDFNSLVKEFKGLSKYKINFSSSTGINTWLSNKDNLNKFDRIIGNKYLTKGQYDEILKLFVDSKIKTNPLAKRNIVLNDYFKILRNRKDLLNKSVYQQELG